MASHEYAGKQELTLSAIEELLLVRRDPCGVLGLLSLSEERLERTSVRESQLGECVVLEVGLSAHQDGCRVAGVALGALCLALRAMDVSSRVAEREMPRFPTSV